MSKKVVIPARANEKPDADRWVKQPEAPWEPHVKPKRLTINIHPEMHMKLKLFCVKRDQEIAAFLRSLIENAISEPRSEAEDTL